MTNNLKFTAVAFLALSASPTWALSRYECKGLAAETVVLTPFEDGSVNLSFDKGPVETTSKFVHRDDVFAAEFFNIGGTEPATL